MQQTVTWRKWGVLAAALAVFALAFALFAGATPAQADEGDLGAGALTTQDEKSKNETTMEWPLQIYTQLEGSDKTTLVKSYTQEEYEALKSSGDAVSVVYNGNSVLTSPEYVTMDDLFKDAGVDMYWTAGSTMIVGDVSGPNTRYTYTYEGCQDLKFFPKTTAAALDADGAVDVPFVFSITDKSSKIADDATAEDAAKANVEAADKADEIHVVMGCTEEDYLAGNNRGNRQWGKVNSITITYTQATKDQIDADAVWPFTVYVQYGDADPIKVKEYTKDEFTALKSDSTDPVSGQYFKGGTWNVSTAVTYVTLEDLLDDAGVAWGKGATIGYGGDPAQGKTSNSFTYEDLQDMYFYPKTTAGEASTEDAVQTPFVFGLTTSNSGVAIGDDQTAADVQKAAATDNVSTCAPYAVFGSLEDEYTSGEGTSVAGKRLWRNVDAITITFTDETQAMHRLYNPYSGEHFYTADEDEYKSVVAAGWTDENIGWTAPVISNVPVYRLYNQYAGDHHYTMKQSERDDLVKAGWTDEGVGWYSDAAEGEVLYREYNPNELSHNHNYTTDKVEHDGLVKIGWTDEGTAWYGVKAAK